MGAGESDRGGGWAGDLGRGPVVLLLLAIVGLIAPRALRSSSDDVSKTTSTSGTLRKFVDDDRTFETRLQRMVTQAGGAKIGTTSTRSTQREDVSVHVLIASLLDPIESHLPNQFDADLSVIQRAAQQYGFTLHRHWLPWQDWLKPEPKVRRHETEPGILLFRRATYCAKTNRRTTELLLVLVVGETPTGGVHDDALIRALDAAYANNPQRIGLIGPATSGASHSLRTSITKWHLQLQLCESLQEWLGQFNACRLNLKNLFVWYSNRLPQKTIEILLITGSATADSALEQLNFPIDGNPRLECKYEATILPDKVVVRELREYLKSHRGIRPEQIALLVEADTAYGQGISSDQLGEWKDSLILPYPMEIGTVRNEYEKQATLKFGPDQGNSAPRQNLGIPWTSPPHANDLPPVFSDVTPAITERRLSLMITALARRDIRAVGLIGTDPKDLLFLAQQIRRHCPNVQLFTIDSNVIFSHPDYYKYFKGTIVASTYPLFINNQEWTRESDTRISGQFPSGACQGLFNATLAHIEMIPRRKSQVRVPLWEYRMPFESASIANSTPPVWISIVGQNSLAPLLVEAECDASHVHRDFAQAPVKVDESSCPSSKVAGKEVETSGILGLPPLTRIAGLVVAIVTAITVVFMVHVCSRGEPVNVLGLRIPRIWQWLSLEQIRLRLVHGNFASSYVTNGWQKWYVVVFISSLALLLAVTTIVTFLASEDEPKFFSHSAAQFVPLAAIGGYLACVAAFVTVIAHLRCFQSYSKSAVWRPVAVVLAAAIGTAPGVMFWRHVNQRDYRHHEVAILVERWGDLFNGVTPIVPLTFLALIPCSWAICQLRRRHFLRIHRIRQPFPKAVSSEAGLARRVLELNERLAKPWWSPSELRDWVLLAGMGVAAWLLTNRWIATADSPVFDWLVFALGGLAFVLIYGLHVRFMAVSGLLERFLRRLAQTSFADSFKQVPERLRDKTAAQVFASAPHPGDLEIHIRHLQKLADSVPAEFARLETALKDDVNEAWAQFRASDGAARDKKYNLLYAMDGVNKVLFRSCRTICRAIAELNIKEPETHSQDGQRQPDISPPQKWQRNAKVYVAMQITTLLRQAFTQIQNLLTFMMLNLLLLLWAFYSYPFQPQRFISLCVVVLVLWMVVCTAYVFIKFNRNEILSNLAGTSANRVTADRALFQQVLTYGAIPLLSMLAFQFPEVGNVLFFWVDGLQQAFR